MKRIITIAILMFLCTAVAQAQIVIGGNVYGGGNKGKVGGSTKVTVKRGDINKVFGGARMADIGGNSYVNLDGANATGYIVINYIYGGNDIAGTIGTAAAVNEPLPAELVGNTDGVDNTWNSYVHLSTKVKSQAVHYTAEEIAAAKEGDDAYGKTTDDIKTPAVVPEQTFIGQAFAGGNGDYTYTDDEGNPLRDGDDYVVKEGTQVIATRATPFNVPELAKTYLDVQGGTIAFAYGGGNNATITEKAVIHVDNPSDVVTQIYVDKDSRLEIEKSDDADSLLTDDRIKNDMGIRMAQESIESDEFQVGRMFGGNNKATMAIRPTWNLQSGKIRNLYSGGNRGAMTSPEGLLLEIPVTSTLVVDNLYGGCRMADVCPTVNGVYTPCTNLQEKDELGNLKYKFPEELAARVLVRGGDVNNVYGGNDVTGKVYGGNAVGIYTSVRGDVYGGGNGAYAYTTGNDNYKDHEVYGDFYFDQGALSVMEALNAFRPNAEQVSIRLKGTEDKPTVIGGAVYCGGNCATLKNAKDDPMVELKIGSYVIADKVFLGNNGEKMVDDDILKLYAGITTGDAFFPQNLTNTDDFAKYMEGAAMDLRPRIVFDDVGNGDPDTYINYTSKIGSFYCGGNKGSMTAKGKTTFKFDKGLVIYEKLVGGCNDADVEAKEGLCADYKGGILGTSAEQANGGYMEGTKIKDRIELSLDNVVIEPRRWNDTFAEITAADLTDDKLKEGNEYYTTTMRSSKFVAEGTEEVDLASDNKYYKLVEKGTRLDWNTAKWSIAEDDFIATDSTTTGDDLVRRLLGGNVYGGCYSSGHVNGNVVININQDLIKKESVFAHTSADDPYTISGTRRSGVLREAQGDDTQAVAISVFGGGCGEETEVWGSATVNLNNGYAFQIFGGGEEGVVGKKNNNGDYVYNANYSTTVNMKGPNAGYSEKEEGGALAETEYIYGGGSEGDVCGDSYVYLGNGRVYDAFGGASNANILGATELYIGHNGGFPWIRDNVYGGNDFGGNVMGFRNHTTVTSRTAFDSEMLKSSTYVKYIQGRVDSIFGGNYGNYDYSKPIFKDYTYSRGEANIPVGKKAGDPRDGFSFPRLGDNSFVHFVPEENGNNKVNNIFGGSEGFPGNNDLNNTMQKESYVLIDDTKTKSADRFANVDIYGGGAFAGVGTATAFGAGRTAIDLYAGSFNNVYGGCNQEGLVGYTRVNVPSGSTVKVNALFGGGKGYDASLFTAKPALAARYCDNYVTCVDYQSSSAIVNDAIYGGNENCRISCDTYINIKAPVMQSSGYQATIYGAGYGSKTVSGRTNVFMNNGSNAYKVFGGGRDGNSFNFATLRSWLAGGFSVLHPVGEGTTAEQARTAIEADVAAYGDILRTFDTYLASNPIRLPEDCGTYPNGSGVYDGTYTNDILPTTEVPMPPYHQTNVHIMNGGNVSGYAYGGGLGENAVVAGSTYLELLGGNVDKDIYGGGQGGPVFDEYGLKNFTATTNVYIESGMARNVYGGGYLGHVGRHDGDISASNVNDIPGVANVVIGKTDGTTFYNGIPAIQRNVYGGGEGGSVYGTANLTINNGYIGYRYKNTATSGVPVYKYVEELDDVKPNAIELAGNVFGGGYVVNSYVDYANVNIFGGTIRGSLYGGGEVGPIGRGTMKADATTTYRGIKNGPTGNEATIYKAGKTNVKMYNGHVLRNVFGGGRGKDSWGGDGTKYMRENMTEEAFAALDLKCKGYVFGQTEVNIYGGEVGSDEGMLYGFGNVFGGGDEGSVYSAYENADGQLCIGKKAGKRYNKGLTSSDPGYNYQGYYYKYENNDFVTTTVGETTERQFTEDCKVVVEPWLQVKTGSITHGGKTYQVGDYIPTAYLNTLGAQNGGSWPSGWNALDVGTLTNGSFKERGVIIHNAVFAGGNIASGSSTMYANETTVFGNATASIHDVYNRDFITIGTGHTGGLYGDGNLTFVDGYRELNITNYGTDYYHLATTLDYQDFLGLPKREQDYYEVKYKCIATNGCTDLYGTTYKEGSTLPKDELIALFTKDDGTSARINADGTLVTEGSGGTEVLQGTLGNMEPNPTIWKENGVVSTYAGRIMNTIQRSDFCGVFGSRMVMKGARDRVPEEVDYTNYTINRVREVSLNKMEKADEGVATDKLHGNYFGIYSIVNYLGALTSDVDFQSTRTTKAGGDLAADGTTTFEQWKETHKIDRKRNNGNCHNQLALASGVYLELTTEESTGTTLDKKVWGPITGVVELDLINVQTGVGGGFVYAKNEHGYRTPSGRHTTTLTALNDDAVTQWDFNYDATEAAWAGGDATTGKKEWQTSGNFIHSSQTIIDDCYNISNRYITADGKTAVPAHYWYISGQVYVYDQYISAYTGSPNAYSETVEMPITINAASNGTMTLLDVQPNLYAYYSSYTNESVNTKLGSEQKLVINDVTYQLNTPISYWDWNKLPQSEKNLFKPNTYVLKDSCYINNTYYPAGYVMLPSEHSALLGYAENKDLTPDDNKNNPVPAVKKATKNGDGQNTVVTDENNQPVYVAFADAFRSSNNMSHSKGYILTYKVTNPIVWDQWYTQVVDGTDSQGNPVLVKNQTGGTGFEDGPTYYPTTSALYGQKSYAVNDIIPKSVYDTYDAVDDDYIPNHNLTPESEGYDPAKKQATFTPAYVVTKEYTSGSTHYYPGAAVPGAIEGHTAPAYVCTSTIKLSDSEYIYVNELMTATEKSTLKSKYSDLAEDIENLIVPAYICTDAGLYGGNYYLSTNNYRALEAWSSMSELDRQSFNFNYDALDLLVDSLYSKNPDGSVRYANGMKYQYDSSVANLDGAKDNLATYSLKTPIDYKATYNGTTDTKAHNGITRTNGAEYSRTEYESLPNEQRHYAPLIVDGASDIYVVNTDFVHLETPYATGSTISAEEYGRLSGSETDNITKLTFTEAGTYYYCRERYQIGEKGEGVEPTPLAITSKIGNTNNSADSGIETVGEEKWVKVGTIISENSSESITGYSSLKNYQTNFTIHGVSPMETSTLYVGRNADINDLSTEKIITVIYKYDYEESDADGTHITPISERHVVNIHIKFESGVPTVPDIQEPGIVLPGTSLTLRTPVPTPGAYEILGGGWELFETPANAESHTNGVNYEMLNDPLYWYQDGFYLAYYAKTYLGKTYSNHVPVHVANYHDLKSVMDDKEHHLHVDYDRTRLWRDSKVYINDYSGSSQNGADLLKDFYDLSLVNSTSRAETDGYTISEGKISATTGTANSRLIGHTLLNNSTETGTNIHYSTETDIKGVKAATNLEFFLRTDIDHSAPSGSATWTPIASGTDEPCFNGTLHGDGHTISGLTPATGTTGSLFGKLCGSVYNLGVTGSFAGAGVADTGGGYVESCWVKTTATTPLETKPYAVFGDPSDGTGYQVVNSYFWKGNKGLYTVSGDNPEVDDEEETITSGVDRGTARAMSSREFYNGTVAYNLNNFYLYKRYSDKTIPSTEGDGKVRYKYFTINDEDNTLELQDYKHYGNHPDECSSGYIDNENIGLAYVEDRFEDGDYRFAGGSTTTSDERHWRETVTTGSMTTEEDRWSPIWPDDYLFFGQKLTYGYSSDAHQDLPSAIVRGSDGRLSKNTDANRVYRAPAYFRNHTMGVAHFNPNAYLAAKEKLTEEQEAAAVVAHEAYPGMTAIDFAGHNAATFNGSTYALGAVTASSGSAAGTTQFYPPLLDDDGLTGITNCDETHNLLVYAPAETATSGYANKATYDVLTDYFVEPAYNTYYNNSDKYRLVTEAPTGSIYGHIVLSDRTTNTDHLLVDKQDFNAPISYTFGSGKVMWYQRKPENIVDRDVYEFVDGTKGWQGISIPFTAELVTTSDKGEITHFYSGVAKNNYADAKVGHEYWLREFKGVRQEGEPTVTKANFRYPDAGTDDKEVTNTFLWNYYYENSVLHNQKDKNNDTYLEYTQKYYKKARTHEDYPLLTSGKPYLLGLPGAPFYEFDLSGSFEAKNTAVAIPQLGSQVITFASAPAATIAVSDSEIAGVTVGNYTYMPTYMSQNIAAGSDAFKLTTRGDKYDKVPATGAATVMEPFRPYFVYTSSGARATTRSIVFMDCEVQEPNANEPQEGHETDKPGTLHVSSGHHKILVTSALKTTVTIRIVNTSGITLNTFDIKPGETIETRVNSSGVYMVQSTDGQYIKKISVR